MKNGNTLKTLSISDIHLGANHTSIEHILGNLDKVFRDTEEFRTLDIVYFAGDVFDQLLSLPDDGVFEIKLWISNLLKLCKKFNVIVRVLEGTPSHDRGQPRLFRDINELSEIGCNLRYFDTLAIEYIEELDINVLYIPDEYHGSTSITQDEVTALLLTHNLEQVDFVVMHGAFPHQFPPHLNLEVHDPEFYLRITKKYVFIGHVHQQSVYKDRILAQGSFDRIHHGEEHDKGYWIVESLADSFEMDKIRFMVNEGALPYKTINLRDRDETEVKVLLDSLHTLVDGSHVRLLTRPMDSNLSLINAYRVNNGHINWTLKPEADGKETSMSVRPTIFIRKEINKNTVADLVKARLHKQGYSPERTARILEVLNEYK